MELTQELSRLLSLSSTSIEHRQALDNIQRTLLGTANSQSKQSSWRTSQDQLHLNAASAVLEFIARVAYRFQLIDTLDFPTLAAALRLLQGLLLVHIPSVRLFSRPSTLETLLAFLAKPSASPLGTKSPIPGSQEAELPVLVLDTILCGLADHPENIRAFEQVGGVAEVVRLLRSKQVGKSTRMKCLEMLYFYLLPEDETKQQSQQQQTPTTAPSTPRRSRYNRSESLKAVLERAEVEWTPRTPRRPAGSTPEPPLSPSFSTPSFTPFVAPSSTGNPGLGISQGPSEQPPAAGLLTPSTSRPRLSRPTSQQSSNSDSDNPFAPRSDGQATPKAQHDMAFFSALAANKRSSRSEMTRSHDAFGPVVRTPSSSSKPASSPPPPTPARQAIRSPLKRSALSSPAKKADVLPRGSPASQQATPIHRHPIVPLPSRRRSLANQEQIAPSPSSGLIRSHTETQLHDTPKNSLSRSQSEQSPLSEILSGSRKVDPSTSSNNMQPEGKTPDMRRRASLQLSQSRSVLRQSLGLLGPSNSNSGTPSRRTRDQSSSRSPMPGSPLRDRKPPSSSGVASAASPRPGVKRKPTVPSPISQRTKAGSSDAAGFKSVEAKKQLLGRHLDDVEGLMSRFQGFAVR